MLQFGAPVPVVCGWLQLAAWLYRYSSPICMSKGSRSCTGNSFSVVVCAYTCHADVQCEATCRSKAAAGCVHGASLMQQTHSMGAVYALQSTGAATAARSF